MTTVRLGRTELVVGKQSFGCLPIQRITKEKAAALLRRAYEGGMNFFDTARVYSDSEEKVGAAFAGMRDKVVLASKTQARTAAEMWKDLETSLRTLGTDYIDIYQAFQSLHHLFLALKTVQHRDIWIGIYYCCLTTAHATIQNNSPHPIIPLIARV